MLKIFIATIFFIHTGFANTNQQELKFDQTTIFTQLANSVTDYQSLITLIGVLSNKKEEFEALSKKININLLKLRLPKFKALDKNTFALDNMDKITIADNLITINNQTVAYNKLKTPAENFDHIKKELSKRTSRNTLLNLFIPEVKAFTLIELMIGVAIVGAAAAVAIPLLKAAAVATLIKAALVTGAAIGTGVTYLFNSYKNSQKDCSKENNSIGYVLREDTTGENITFNITQENLSKLKTRNTDMSSIKTEFVLNTKTRALIVKNSNGEYLSLTDEQRNEAIDKVILPLKTLCQNPRDIENLGNDLGKIKTQVDSGAITIITTPTGNQKPATPTPIPNPKNPKGTAT